MRYYKLLIFLLVLSAPVVMHGQDKGYLYGELYDSATKEPVIFATIIVKNKGVGIISNDDGSFRIPMAMRMLGDTLLVSSIGYNSKELVVHNLVINTVNRIALAPSLTELKEVVLVSTKYKGTRKVLSAKEIIQTAMDRILQNYPTTPYSYVGYYRDYQVKEDQYYNLNEAILEVFDQGFTSNDFETTEARIYEYKQNNDFPKDTISQKPYNYKDKSKVIPQAQMNSYGGNEFVIMRIMDAIRNYNTISYSYINTFNTDVLLNHTITLEEDVFMDGERIYNIAMSKNVGHIVAKGNIFISSKDYAIHKLNYTVVDGGIFSDAIGKREQKVDGNNLLYRIRVAYKKEGNHMFPNYISFNNSFTVRQPPEFVVDSAMVDFEKSFFEIKFTREPEKRDLYKTKNYEIFYNGKRIKIDRIESKNARSIILYPAKKSEHIFELFPVEFNFAKFSLDVNNLTDVSGNKINEVKIGHYNQYREFFTQQIHSENKSVDRSLFMQRNKPIFKDQQQKKPDNYEDFWMNTPLQHIK
ncbi:carboxypeptidase-like regulatory domain-containing protein [Cellulophaga sp. F20128]|uniref:carboxypeptidase-like regulatory domain-containing protein n=1 Tax=Cellulophaga sp. F20128 TaxID=2926413 RepID=UPI001FF4FEB9|nr:carboxypeptidase-like regulatory domain-containing protein [Cellulophaga sp. F20128]MCK0156570.1 carboxypeptidase-like regulatory domain-containing protein [Cellulophaga sp. F20128]